MEEEKTSSLFKDMKDDVSNYVNNSIKLAKVTAYEKISLGSSSAAFYGIITCIVLFVLLLGLITLAVFMGDLLDNMWLGFGVVTLLTLVLLLILLLLRKPIKKTITNKVARFLIESDDEEDNQTKK